MTLQQLPLNVQLPTTATFATWVAGQNVEALALLAEGNQPLTYLWGKAGVGKSHLLHAMCSEARAQVIYLPLAELKESVDAGILRGLESYQLICLDDIDAIVGEESWGYELFALLNRVRDSETARLVVTATTSPAQLQAAYPDVQSRLSWGLVLQLHALSDQEKITALQLRAQAMGLELRSDTAQFMVQRLGRDMENLIASLERLDRASIAAQRKLTIPFIKAVLAI